MADNENHQPKITYSMTLKFYDKKSGKMFPIWLLKEVSEIESVDFLSIGHDSCIFHYR